MRTTTRLFYALPLCALLILAAGLAPRAAGQGRGHMVSVRGVITQVSPPGEDDPPDILGWIEVVGQEEEDTAYDRAVVAVTERTKIRRADRERPRRGTFEDLEVGRVVEVWLHEPVLLSYPVQGAARAIRILE